MAFSIFGFTLKKSKDEKLEDKRESFAPPTNDDGATTVESSGTWGTYIDLDYSAKSEFELITRYRDMALHPETDIAIDDIVNEAIVIEDEKPIVGIDLSKVKYSKSIKDKIEEEFDTVIKLLDFQNQAYEIFRKWYVDGRLLYHMIIDEKKEKEGLQELRYIDPRQIRKIREIEREKDPETGAEIVRVIDDYFLFNAKGVQYNNLGVYSPQPITTVMDGTRIEPDCVLFAHSGLTDKFSSMIISHLHKAIKPLNNLKMMEDAVVIYRITRAPERRIFYVDVGNLPKSKAEDYLRSVMQNFKNKLVYDVSTGAVRDDRRHLSMLEDFWLPRRNGSQGTTIDTLPGGQHLGEMEDVKYFQTKLYKSMNVPASRMESDQKSFNLGRSSEITRDEVKFAKFIKRLRNRFTHVFDQLLKTQLILKGIITPEDWEDLRDGLKYVFCDDNYFSELKESEILRERIAAVREIESLQNPGKYFSTKWIREHVLKQTPEEQEKMEKEAEDDKEKYGEPEPNIFINQSTRKPPIKAPQNPTETEVAKNFNQKNKAEE